MKPVKDLKTYYFECDCSSQEHTLGVAFDVKEKEVMIFTQLARNKGFLKRLILGIKYIFGHQSKYGQWEETLIQEDKFLELYNIMTRFSYSANIRDKSKQKIQKALTMINNGGSNPMVNDMHKQKQKDVLQKYKKDK